MTTLLGPAVAVRLGPNWFATVMGTGIVATAAASLPWQVPGLRAVATVVWAAALVLLVLLTVAFARDFRSAADDPVLVQFWGAPPMALLTVGAGTLLLGRDWIGESAAVAVDAVLWTAGTVLGLVVAVVVPYLMVTRHAGRADAAFGARLMPVVPPMVSAATGALLVPYVPAGPGRLDLLLACYAMFGLSLVAAMLVIGQLWGRPVAPPAMVPTLWIVLGPLGQSVTAVHLLARAVPGVLPAPYAEGAAVLALLYGVPVLGFALFWLALVAALTVRTARAGLGFSMTWWGFTFPLGTVVTAASGLAAQTGSPALAALAAVLYVLLVAAWSTVGVRTVRHVKKV
jgi:tellurite resistance protein TehA-like permease